MGIYVNRGNKGFQSAVRSQIYVDKTGMLEYLNSVIGTEQRFICVSRARRFGKSMAAGMIAAYYSRGCDSHMLFDGKEISKAVSYGEYMNKYDVIHLDMAFLYTYTKTAQETVLYLHKSVIEELKQIYPGILDDSCENLSLALAQIHVRTGVEFIVIIDEWDALFREDIHDVEGQKLYIELLRGLFKGEQAKESVALAYMTGIFPIVRYNSESALNNFDEFTMLNPGVLSQYVGFTETEVQQLCDEAGMDFSEIADWYDGYSFYNREHIYNPNSVVKAMRYGVCDSYWTGTVSYDSLRNYITYNFDGLKDVIICLLAGEHCQVNTRNFQNNITCIKDRDDVLTVLIHLGYLAYDFEKRETYIPNNEIREEFLNAVEKARWTEVLAAIHASDELLRATLNQDEAKVAKAIDDVHMESTSVLSYNDENSLACVIELAYYSAVNEYIKIREFPTGKGFADVVYLPKQNIDKPALVIELKYNRDQELTQSKSSREKVLRQENETAKRTVSGAIRQIRERKYTKSIEHYTGKILLVGITYDKKSKEHSCVIEEWNKEYE